jgi:hypothetical protein
VGVSSGFEAGGLSYIAQADIFDQVGVEVASCFDFLQQREHHIVNICVLEATLLAFRQGRSDG